MKISGLSCITKKIFLVFLGHPNGQWGLLSLGRERAQRRELAAAIVFRKGKKWHPLLQCDIVCNKAPVPWFLDDKIIFLLIQITNTTNILFLSSLLPLGDHFFEKRKKAQKAIFIRTVSPAMGKMVTPISAMLMFRKIALLLRRPSPPELEKSLSSIEKQIQKPRRTHGIILTRKWDMCTMQNWIYLKIAPRGAGGGREVWWGSKNINPIQPSIFWTF